jgi:uncharacterized protein (TIGR03083 family)
MSQDKSVAKEPIIALLAEEWAVLDGLLGELEPGQWSRPSCLPGWRVTDIVAHLIGTEEVLAGESAPESGVDPNTLPHVRNAIAAFNEHWVQALRNEAPAAMLARFRDVTARRLKMLEQMPQSDFDAQSWTPAGYDTYARFMQIRVYDCWMHEQDIRAAVGLPGNEDGPTAVAALDEVTRALGYIVGKLGGAPDGSVVRLDLTGPMHRWLTVAVEGRARVVEEAPAPPTATLSLSSSRFMRLTGGRTGDRSGVELGGDETVAWRILDNLAFTI